MLADRFGRRFSYLRLSITDLCNFRCSYCLPDGIGCHKKAPAPLRLDEIERLLRVFAQLGVVKVRVTGGEPSLRRDLPGIIHGCAATPGIETVAMTTNGYRLAKNVSTWRNAGLDAINISIDSLDPALFKRITGHDRLPEILTGLDRALELGLRVKVNAVLLKGLNATQLPRFLDWLRGTPITLRFIELMRTGDNHDYFNAHHFSGQKVREWLGERGWVRTQRPLAAGPADEYAHPDYVGKLGLITPYGPQFCQSCNRLRTSSQGKLHLCLFADFGIDLRALLQHDDQAEALQARIQNALMDKTASHQLPAGLTGATRNLAMLGG